MESGVKSTLPTPLTVKVPFAYVALPVFATEPTSSSSHLVGRGCVVTSNQSGLLLFMVGATITTTFPLLAPAGTVTSIVVFVQPFTGIETPPNMTTLFPWEAPNPEPIIANVVPTEPAVTESEVITGAGLAVELTDTLSNVAVAKLELL